MLNACFVEVLQLGLGWRFCMVVVLSRIRIKEIEYYAIQKVTSSLTPKEQSMYGKGMV